MPPAPFPEYDPSQGRNPPVSINIDEAGMPRLATGPFSGCASAPSAAALEARSNVVQFFLAHRRSHAHRLKIAAVINLLDDWKAWELNEVDIAEREFEEDSAGGSAVHNADLLPCCVDHDAGKAMPGNEQVGIP